MSLIRVALQLCPREFRERYGEEIAAAFDQHPSLREFTNVLIEGTGMRLESLGLNLVLALRSLRRSWLAALVAIVAIAFGVGVNVAGAAILNAAVLYPLPVPDAQQVYYVSAPAGIAYADGSDLARAAGSYGSVALSEADHKTYQAAGHNVVLSGALVDPTYFSLLRVRPILGTFFDASTAVTSIVLSEKFWRSNFGGSDVVGQSFVLGTRTYTIAGIAPARFHGLPQYDVDAAYWLPILPTQPGLTTDRSFSAVVRTKEGLDPGSASSAIGKALQAIAQSRDRNAPCCVSVVAAQTATLMRLGPLFQLIYIVTWIVLVIGCINVANLQLARTFTASAARATRAVLGATPGQINSEIVTEIGLLSALGCLLGLAIAWGILQFGAAALPVLADVGITAGVVVYALVLVAVTTAIIAAVPCIAQAKSNLALMLKGVGQSTSGRGGRRFIGGLVLVQICLTAVLVLTCGAVLSAFAQAQNVPNGFSTRNLYVAGIDVSAKLSDSTPESVREAYARRTSAALVTALHDTPGIVAAAGATQVPFFCCNERNFSIPNGPSDIMAVYAAVTPEYFSALQVPLAAGRFFDEKDNENQSGVAIVDTLFAQRYYGRNNVLGERLIGRANYRVVGIVAPIRQEYGVPPKPMVYLSMAQFPRFAAIVVRTNGAVNDVARLIVSATHSVDASIPEPTVYSYDEVKQIRETPSIAGSWTIVVFAIVALVLALSGVYAISAFSSQLRQREFAIRTALGATDSSLLIVAARRPLIQAFIAVLVGALLAYVVTGVLSAALSIDVSSSLGAVVVAFAVVMGCVILATVVPALRALRMSPATLLRSE